jgi:NhaP-type Na+/H+ or K+/H+ antiporter
VSAGLYLGFHRSAGAFSARSRLQSAAFWHSLVFLINAALFVLVGLSFHAFTTQAGGPLGRLILTGVVVVAVVIITRVTWMEATGWLGRRRRGVQPRVGNAGWRERAALGWSGMRGAITLAAALLAVPQTAQAGHTLAGRDDIIYLGFAVIIVSVIAQGLTLPLLVARLGPVRASGGGRGRAARAADADPSRARAPCGRRRARERAGRSNLAPTS